MGSKRTQAINRRKKRIEARRERFTQGRPPQRRLKDEEDK